MTSTSAASYEVVGQSKLVHDVLTSDFGAFETINKWSRILNRDLNNARTYLSRSKHTAVTFRECIYIFGGDNGRNMLNDLLIYDLGGMTCRRAFTTGCPPAPRYHHSAVVYEDSMFIFGGYTGDINCNSNLANKNDLFEYRFTSGHWIEWKYQGRVPVARAAHGAAVYDNRLWIFAGYDGNARLNDMWIMPLLGESHSWEEVKQSGNIPPTCCNFALAVSRDSMYVFSGQSGAKITNDLYQFKFSTRQWTKISSDYILQGTPPPPEKRYGHTMVAFDRHLYVFGGATGQTLKNELHSFDIDAQSWGIVEPLSDLEVPSGRVFHASCVVDSSLYIFGGTIDNNVRRGDIYKFQFSNYPPCTLRNDFARLLESKQLCDVRFLLEEDVVIYAHIALVCARSPWLRQRIKETREMTSTYISEFLDVALVDVPHRAFELILSYIYTDQIKLSEVIQEYDPSSNEIILLMMDVYKLSLQFHMTRLEHICVHFIEASVTQMNVLLALQRTATLALKFIKDFCLRFIVKDINFNAIVMSKEFETLDKSLIVEVVRHRQLPSPRTVQDYTPYNFCTNSLEKDMESFLNAGDEFCDIYLELNNDRIPAHKSILAARCGYFEAQFRSFMPSNSVAKISIGDNVPSTQAFKSLLRYIYYGNVVMPPEDSLYLLPASQFFCFTNCRLKEFCKHNIEVSVSYNNAIQILEAADNVNALEMKKYSLDIIVRNYSLVVQKYMPQLKELRKELLLDIITALAESGTIAVGNSSTNFIFQM